jgi:holo-[acyl-carrier protein] synthase
MILGIGIDLVSIERMRRALERHGERFEQRILCEAERALCAERADRAEVVAGRFAAKEAAFKALGGPPSVSWRDILVLREPSGAPRLQWSGNACPVVALLGNTRVHVSITHDGGMAAAVVVLEALA